MDTNHSITVNKKELEATLYEISRSTWTLEDLNILMEQHGNDEGRKGEISPHGIEMITEASRKATNRQMLLINHLEALLKIEVSVVDTKLGMFDVPMEGESIVLEGSSHEAINAVKPTRKMARKPPRTRT